MADQEDTAAQRELDAEEGARVGWAAARRQLAAESRPILFSAPMILAILAGTKSQTRRVITPPMPDPITPIGVRWSGWSCPYVVEDTLWVREAWRLPAEHDDLSGAEVGAQALAAGYPVAPIQYEADGHRTAEWSTWPEREPGRYRHARFMPRWASRLTLRVVGATAERVQDITEADAIAEGVADVEQFAVLWESLNAPRGCGWDVNPFVWVVRFERSGGEA